MTDADSKSELKITAIMIEAGVEELRESGCLSRPTLMDYLVVRRILEKALAVRLIASQTEKAQ